MNSPFSSSTLILFGHGTTLNEDSAAAVRRQAGELRRRHPFAEVREAFWKQPPLLTEVITQTKTPLTFLVPFFISEGYFSEEVIPKALGFSLRGPERSGRVLERGGQRLFYCQPAGTHDSMTTVLLGRAREVIEQFPFPRAPKPKDLTLIIAAHGTEKNDKSRQTAERQIELLRAKNLYAAVHAVFLEEDPRIPSCYELAQTKNIAVVPFFISDGLHVQEDIPVLLGEPKKVVQQRLQNHQPAWRNPTEKHGKLVWYTSAVGTAPLMCDVIMERIREALLWG